MVEQERGRDKITKHIINVRRIAIIISMVGMVCSCQPRVLVLTDYGTHTLALRSDSLPKKPSADSLIYPYRLQLQGIMDEVLFLSAQPLLKEQPEGLLGDAVCDLLFQNGHQKGWQFDAVFLNNGGLRTNLPKGAVTVGNAFELMPFDNEVVIVSMKGTTLYKVLLRSAEKGGDPVSGLTLEIKENKPARITVGGKNVDSTAVYRILTSDYLANGGDQLDCMNEKIESKPMHAKLRDMIIESMRMVGAKSDSLYVQKDGRVSYVH